MQNNQFDELINQISDYVCDTDITSTLAYETAYYDLLDSLACAIQALQFPACKKLLGPVVPGANFNNGCRVPGTHFELEPVHAAFNIGAQIRWLDFNDTWLAAEWGHPSDNLGAILAVADYLSRHVNQRAVSLRQVMTAMIKAHEIQGVLALNNSFNAVGLDHIILVKVASTAVAAEMLGGTREQIRNAITHAWLDGHPLRTYRHAPNAGPRKSWAAGDATSRAVRLALIAMTGEIGYPSVMSTPRWGFHDVLFKGKSVTLERELGSYVMENILFKIAFPAEFHAQTAVECAFALHPEVRDKFQDIKEICVYTQKPAIDIIAKEGPLTNPAARDHCLQYMIAVGLLHGELTAQHYEEATAKDPRIDALRSKMIVKEDKQFTRDYYDSEKRAIPNAIQVVFNSGEKTELVTVEYPVGHRRRREEGIPLLLKKFYQSIEQHFTEQRAKQIVTFCCQDRRKFEESGVDLLMDLFRSDHQ